MLFGSTKTGFEFHSVLFPDLQCKP